MRSHILTLLLLAAVVLTAAGHGIMIAARSGPDAPWLVSSAMMLAGIGLLVFPLLRLARFHRRLLRFLRRLLDGNYDVGFRISRFQDEVCQMERLLERLAIQLRRYDDLRAERVRHSLRALDAVMEHSEQPMMMLDVRDGAMECNPAMLALLGLTHRTVSLKAVESIAANRRFTALIRRAVETERTIQQGRVALQMPAHEHARELDVRVVPIQTGDAELESALVFVLPPRHGGDDDAAGR